MLGLAIAALPALATALHVPGSVWAGALWRKDLVVALLAAATLAYFAAVRRVLRRPVPLGLVLLVAAAMRLPLLPTPPMLSTDIYRYVWDGRVQQAGINPYRYIPADPALASLRDTSIYPRINRAGYAPTIYAPAAQLVFRAAAALWPTVTGMKAMLVALEAMGIAALVALLRLAGLPRGRVLIYAWNPLAAWTAAADGHVDAVAVALLALALLAVAVRRPAVAGAVLAGAVLTKFLPVVVAPALWRRWGWRLPAAALAGVAALYALYADVGWRVFGFLPAYTHEEGFAQGFGFYLLRLVSVVAPLPAWSGAAYVVAAGALLALLAARIVFRSGADTPVRTARHVAVLAAATTAAMSPHYPWYYAWLALPACLAPLPSVIWLSAAPVILYSDPWHSIVLLPTAVFVPAAWLAWRDWRAWRREAACALPP